MRRLLPLCVILAGCGFTPPPVHPAAGTHAGGPQTAEEKEVAEFLTQPPPKGLGEVKWLEWGPNDPDGTLTDFYTPGRVRLVRVKYECKNEGEPRKIEDRIFHITDGFIDATPDNPDGTGWLEKAKARKKVEEDAAMRGSH